MAKQHDTKLVLENGTQFYGSGFGARRETVCEIIFNTSMVGYQEIVSNPSVADKIIVMTYPLVGNYGIADEDFESRAPALGGLVVRECNDNPSNFRWTKTLSETLEENNIPGIAGVDTRRITRMLRNEGMCRAVITPAETPADQAVAKIKSYDPPKNLVAKVSSKKLWYSRTANPEFNVVAVDCGIKQSLIRRLNELGCNVTVVPYNNAASDILALKPDGVVISNGPGHPGDIPEVVQLVKDLRGRAPIFGIALGFEIVCLAYGANVVKTGVGKHGGYPVRNIRTQKIGIAPHAACFSIDKASLKDTGLEITFENVLDSAPEGVASAEDNVMAVQFHPEGAPGANDFQYVLNDFVELMNGGTGNNA